MDPFSQRLRKQRERSSLRARQLNKNALTMLHRHLRVLERRQQQNTRALVRTRQSILEELDAFQDLEYDVLEPRRTPPPRPRTLPPLRSHSRQSPELGSPGVSSHAQSSTENRQGGGTSVQHSLSTALNKVSWGSLDAETSPSFRRHHECATGGDHYHSVPVCRFGASSPLSPCRHFPCSTPRTYHSFMSDIRDPLPMADRETVSTRSQTPALFSNSFVSLSDSPSSPFSSLTAEGKASGRTRSAVSQIRQPDGHISPRTSVQERLRGLRQLVQELRAKNEEKRPRDRAINYGEPVSRRLLRKPVVPVSERVL